MDMLSLWEKTLPPESTHKLWDRAEKVVGIFFGTALVLTPIAALAPLSVTVGIAAVIAGTASLL